MASGMSRTIDPDRPQDLTDEQRYEVARHPEVQALREQEKVCAEAKKRSARTGADVVESPAYSKWKQAQTTRRNAERRLAKVKLREF